MSETVKARGQCLCGAVQIEAGALSTSVGTCHCATCRRWGGGPLFAVDAGTDVEIGGEDKITIFSSSDWAERGFCSQCGTHLFYHLKGNGQYIMPAGLFGEVEGYVLDHQVFIDQRPAWYQFANRTKDMTGEELFAMHAPKDDS
ncbi:MAG: GFA family protein [Alphaproteobacteria bacterium]